MKRIAAARASFDLDFGFGLALFVVLVLVSWLSAVFCLFCGFGLWV
jgi:hypothetical protein